jgi:L,D-transpeptidase catalytic domain
MRRSGLLALAALLALAPSALADTAAQQPDQAAVHDFGTRVHVASGISDGGKAYSLKGDAVTIEGPRPFAESGVATVEIFRGKHKLATVRAKLRGPQGKRGGFSAKFRARRLGDYKLRVTIRRDGQDGSSRTAKLRVTAIAPVATAGAGGIRVRLLQRGLHNLGFVTSMNGQYDAATQRAVLAFRKTNNMARVTSASKSVFELLFAGKGGFTLRYPGAGKHVEFDWSRQVLVLARGGKPERIYHASSGKPSTPTVFGTFHFYSKTPGTNAKGMVYSNYFIRGYAIHGYAEVPPYAASHGCIRVPIPNAVSIYSWINLGDTIFVYR